MTASTELGAFCSSLNWERIPGAARSRTGELVLDFVGVAIAGSAETSSRAMARAVGVDADGGGSGPLSRPGTSSPAVAALVNGTSGHALELDDVTRESSLHPGVVVIPAALAVAEATSADPRRFGEAVVAGYEVTLRVGNALGAASAYRRGFHPTGVAGIFGAATSAGLLMGLDGAGLGTAMGIAGTMASGSLEYLSDGAWTKRLNAGWAAHSGVVAAQLAAAGFTGPASALDGRLGVLRAYTDAPKAERLLEGLGNGLQIMTVAVKPYACCRYNHGLIDAVRAIRMDERFALDRIKSIRLGVLSAGALLVAEPIEQKRNPRSVVDAQFSAPFAAAVGLVFDAAGPDQFRPAVIDDDRIRGLMSMTECFVSTTLDAEYPARWPARVEIELDDGLVLTSDIPFAKGEPENPVTRVELLDKFLGLTAPFDVSASLGERILAFDRQVSIASLLDDIGNPGPVWSRGDRESAILR